MIRVVKVNGLRTPEQRAGVVYVGRSFAGWPAHQLANPFKLIRDTPHFRDDVLRRYHEWLLARPVPVVEAALSDLWAETEQGAKPLGCWCVDATAGDGSPVVCHAQVLAELLRERFVPGGV